MTSWIIPGSALEAGRGWKIWLSVEGTADFTPGGISVTTASGEPQEVTMDWALQPPLRGMNRRIGTLTVALQVPAPGAPYIITFRDHGQQLRLQSLPSDLRQPVSFMFSSCFYRPADPAGRYLDAVRAIPQGWKPAFKLLIGDQLYCDWPPERDFAYVAAGRAYETYGYRYNTYWGDEKVRLMMAESPNYFIAEDHEYWNDFPETHFRHVRSWPGYRQAFQQAADDYYLAFQACNNPGGKRWCSFRVGPVSFFASDTRSEREQCRSETSRLMSAMQWSEVESWGHSLQGPGILALGQPLLRAPQKRGDLTLSNFTDDYDRLWRIIERAATGQTADGKPHDVLVLAGDIHTTRYSEASRDGLTVREFVASPASKIWPDRTKPDVPPKTITIGNGTTARTWIVRNAGLLTLDETLGLVRLTETANGTVRVELGSWRIRPFDSRNWIARVRKPAPPQGDFQFVFNRTIELR